jgi:hypothetical protein
MLRSLSVPRLVSGLLLALFATTAFAAPPSDADIERLLKASRAESMLNAILPQMETMQRQQFEQLTAGKELNAEQKAEAERIQARTNQVMREALAWEQMRPLYVDVYKQTFTSEDVRAIAKFYESKAGRSLLDKTPTLMQNLMTAIQQKMIPVLQELRTEMESVSVEEPKAPAPPAAKKKKKR